MTGGMASCNALTIRLADMTANPSLQPTRYGWLCWASHAAELRWHHLDALCWRTR